jgi:hypothetical protein
MSYPAQPCEVRGADRRRDRRGAHHVGKGRKRIQAEQAQEDEARLEEHHHRITDHLPHLRHEVPYLVQVEIVGAVHRSSSRNLPWSIMGLQDAVLKFVAWREPEGSAVA